MVTVKKIPKTIKCLIIALLGYMVYFLIICLLYNEALLSCQRVTRSAGQVIGQQLLETHKKEPEVIKDSCRVSGSISFYCINKTHRSFVSIHVPSRAGEGTK